jgi:DNA modification methylase
MLIQADARSIPLRDGCVQCVVTSPPYWGLRDYGVAGQLGMQQTPEAYVSDLADVFDEVRRVLRDDGICWVNLGDSYQNAKGQAHGIDPKQPARRHGLRPQDVTIPGLKPKDLVGVPWLFAFEARRRGWYLRSDVVWSKPNPMPESVQDRPTKAHEYLFLLTKSASYYYDAAAIREPYAASTLTQFEKPYEGQATKEYASVGVQNPSAIKKRITDKQRGHGRRHAGFNDRWDAMPKDEQQQTGANKRSVWTIATMPYAGAHFATMPEKLVEPCILAGSRPGDLVFDPFSGSGTVLAVAQRFGRRAVGTDLNPAYHALAKKRTAQRGLMFSAPEPATAPITDAVDPVAAAEG